MVHFKDTAPSKHRYVKAPIYTWKKNERPFCKLVYGIVCLVLTWVVLTQDFTVTEQ